ncbi:MAG: DNRLRE domain-containing protein, partial [Candidatus Lokiarchaeota archaeon]|nr:DNRLRE domain-containing protein [Candidatus Lokiarchaeota archaeon]
MIKKKILTLLTILFLFTIIPIFTNNTNINNNDSNLKTSTDNYLFNGVPYDITLNDVYDDENATKIYTGANFQSSSFNTTTYDWNDPESEEVSPVNNTEIQYGSPANIDMIDGTSDYNDNMRILDASYTKFTSVSEIGDALQESPAQWDDFTFDPYGSGTTTGELETNNNINYAEVSSGSYSGAESFLGYIVPADSDILTGWTDGDAPPHWSLLDEAKGDTNGDGGNIVEASSGKDDRWNFNTLTVPEGSSITKIVICIYLKKATYPQTTQLKFTASTGQSLQFALTGIYYYWKSTTFSGLSLTQANLDGFWLNVEPVYVPSVGGYIDIEAVYVDIYVSPNINEHDWYMTWDVDNPSLYSIDYFKYDYRTTASIECNLSIYNWDTTGWLELESNTDTGWHTNSYGLTDPYISITNQVRVQFQTGTNGVSFDIEMDQIALDFRITTSKLETTITFPFARYNEDLLAMSVSSWQMTNITQLTNFSIWSFTSSAYVLINSSSNIVLRESYYNTLSPNDFINSTGAVILHWIGENPTSNFDFSVDLLSVKIYYKMDLTHTISFETNGLWKYRWEIFGSLHYTDWTFFEVVDSVPNFDAISQSEVLSRWILQGADISPVEDFHDDINTDYWNLVGMSESVIILELNPDVDAHVKSSQPSINYGAETSLSIGKAIDHITVIFLKTDFDDMYLSNNITNDGKIDLYQISMSSTPSWVNIYETTSFEEMSITWNNQPAKGDYISQTYDASGWNEWVSLNLSDTIPEYYMFEIDVVDDWRGYSSSEAGSNNPKITYDISKNYFGSGYTYMQTNETETIALQSIDYTSHYTLNSGDYFEVDFQTSSDSQINVILLKDGEVQKSLVLSQSGNTNFNRHTAQISVSEDLEFDQLKISSTFEDTDNMKVYDIKTYKYTLTGDYKDFHVSPNSQKAVYLTPDTYNLRIFEEGDTKVDVNLTIPVPDNHYLYIPTEIQEGRLRLTTMQDVPLSFNDYDIYIHRTLGGSFDRVALLYETFRADIGSTMWFEVWDRFGNLVGNYSKPISDFINVKINVYQLQLKNLMDVQTTISINKTLTFPLLSGDTIEFMLASRYYQVFFYDEYNMDKNFTLYLDSNKAFQLNSSLKTIYFGMFSYDGLGMDHDLVRFYINDARKELGFNSMLENTLELIILDFFNNTLANETIDANAYDNSEYNLFVEIYTLNILNRFTYEDMIINITQVDSGIYMNQLIPVSSALLYRFIPNVNYSIQLTFLNDTIYSIRNINLTSNNQIESFGVPYAPEEYPKDVYFGAYTSTGLGVDFNLLRLYIDGTRTNFGFNTIENAIIDVVVKDYFNSTLFDDNIDTTGIYEYNILVNLFSLKILNDGEKVMNYTLTLSASSIKDSILPREIIQYNLAQNSYTFDYINQEDNSFHTISITLDENKFYVLNSTYYDVYIGIFDTSGSINWNNVKFYINNTRSNFGFNILTSNDVNLTVLDYFNSTLFNQVLSLRGLNEYNIYITLYSLKIQNQAQETANYTLTLGSVFESGNILPNEIKEYLLATNNYVFNYTNNEDGVLGTINVNLNQNRIYILNTTYYDIFFSLFDLNLHSIDPNLYEFRLNDSIQDFGLIIDLQTDDYTISVVDRFGTSLFDNIITLRNLNEYRIDITLFELQ